jgi:hypothetical protein
VQESPLWTLNSLKLEPVSSIIIILVKEKEKKKGKAIPVTGHEGP